MHSAGAGPSITQLCVPSAHSSMSAENSLMSKVGFYFLYKIACNWFADASNIIGIHQYGLNYHWHE